METAVVEKEARKPGIIERLLVALGKPVGDFFSYVGGICIMTWNMIASYIKPPYDWREIIIQIDYLGVRGLPIAIIASMFIGGVMVLQLSYSLATFGAKTFVGALLGIALVRWLSPVLMALLLGGRVSAGIAAELGSMVIAEQIDAMRSLGANPLKKLVAPRVIACTFFVFPITTMLADVLGIMGGLITAVVTTHQDPQFFMNNVRNYLDYKDIFSGWGKVFFFGYFIAIIGCYQGLNTTGGTEGLGKSTTKTVVITMVTILISDFFLTKFFFFLMG